MNATEYFDHWDKVRRDLLRAVAVLEDEDLDFRPAERYDRTLGDILRHIINLEQGWIHYVVRRELDEWPPENHDRLTTVTEIEAEITRTREAVTEKESARQSADSVFKT